ncbi:MAG: acetyl-CoA carboxylase biotin carboxyl carrier protein, partial [Romboutsia sp.]|nr:acetyl-CoA carboxylase biotin carboxyl carrier protein [Romboutsia sp.]
LDTNLNNNIEAAIDKDINEDIEDFEYIKSPMVGTFYKAISPDEPPFVSVNQKISKGDIVCIVEAMKLMNEISSDCDCEIIDVLVENGVMVEYGEPLFKIRRK